MNKIFSLKSNAIFLATLLFLGTIATILPSAHAQPYYEDNRYDPQYPSEYTNNNSYESEYPSYPDNSYYKSKDSSSVNKIKCNNINSNNNGVDVSLGVPNDDDAITEAQAEDESQTTTANGWRDGYKQNDNDFRFICINNNDNENNIVVINETIPEPEPTITCEECFTEILTVTELEQFLEVAFDVPVPVTIEQACIVFSSGLVTEEIVRFYLEMVLPEQDDRIDDIIECLIEAGIELLPEEVAGLNAQAGGALNTLGGLPIGPSATFDLP